MKGPTKDDITTPEPPKRQDRCIYEDLADIWNDPVEMTLPAVLYLGMWWTPMPTTILADFCAGQILATRATGEPIRALSREEIRFVGCWRFVMLIPTSLAKTIVHSICLGTKSVESYSDTIKDLTELSQIAESKAHPVPEPSGYT